MAADSPTPGTETWGCRCWPYDTPPPLGHRHFANGCTRYPDGPPAAPSPVGTTEPPAETQQDDDLRDREGGQYVHDALTQLAEQWTAAERHEEADLLLSMLAARPSADTEKLRARVVRELLESDALTGDSEGTPERYTVHADDVPYLVDVVLRAALDAR